MLSTPYSPPLIPPHLFEQKYNNMYQKLKAQYDSELQYYMDHRTAEDIANEEKHKKHKKNKNDEKGKKKVWRRDGGAAWCASACPG